MDPLDGTTNFAHGFPVFCVSMDLQHNNVMVAGLCYDPTRNEMFAAERGKGANAEQPANSRFENCKASAESLVGTGFPSHKRHKNPNVHFYHQITLRTHGVRRAGSAALDLCYVACGRTDGFWEFNLNPGTRLLECCWSKKPAAGSPISKVAPFQLNSRETLASNGLIHSALMHEFEEIFAGRGLEPLPDPREYANKS